MAHQLEKSVLITLNVTANIMHICPRLGPIAFGNDTSCIGELKFCTKSKSNRFRSCSLLEINYSQPYFGMFCDFLPSPAYREGDARLLPPRHHFIFSFRLAALGAGRHTGDCAPRSKESHHRAHARYPLTCPGYSRPAASGSAKSSG